MPTFVTLFLALGLLARAWAADTTNGTRILVNADHSNGIYAAGQSIRWHVEVTNDSPAKLVKSSYAIKKGGLTVLREGNLELTNGTAEIVCSNPETGTWLLEIKTQDQERRKAKGLGGAVVAPESIHPSSPPPADFDAFWQAKLKELSSVPMEPQLAVGESGRTNVDYWQITMQNIRGTHIRGQLARRKSGEKFPAMLIVQGAGVYGLQPSAVTSPASKGWLALNLNAHDLPIDQPPKFYEEQSQGPLKDYWAIGNDDRETSYFLRMYLACYRAAQYLTERRDWDGQTLLVTGVSQGGLQTLLTAALHPRVTAAIAGVPGGCDLTAAQVGRTPGWPVLFFRKKGDDSKKVIAASRYYDIVNFTSRIKCPVLASAGLIDEVCPAGGILAALNQVKAPKEIVILPLADHMGTGNSHLVFHDRTRVWQAALLKGMPPPVEPSSH